MTDAPKSSSLILRVRSRLRVTSVARALFISSTIVLGIALLAVLSIRLLGLIPRAQEQNLWLLGLPAVALLAAAMFHRKVEQQSAARAVDQHAHTKDLFLTLVSLNNSAGEYQPLVATSAEERAGKIAPSDVVPYRVDERVALPLGIGAVLALLILFLPQFDPFGKVEAATKVEEQKKEIKAILKETRKRTERLKKEEERSDEDSEDLDLQINKMKTDFRKMQPKKKESNARILEEHRIELGDKMTAADNKQLRQMMNQPISQNQLGARSKKMNEWLKELQEGKTEKLQQQLQKAQETMSKMLEAKTPEERESLANELQKDLQDLQRFSKDKAGSKELTEALSKALKSLQAAKKPGEKGERGEQLELSKEAMEALKESLKLSEKELEQVANSAEELKKLTEAMETLQKAEQLNQQEQLDGSKCEGCESLQDYADLYAQLMGQGGEGEGDKDRNEGDGGGVGRGGETPEDDSDPEGYKKEKEKPQIQAGKILLTIKTKEYAEEKDFDPEKMREYQKSISNLKSSVQSAIDSEEIPPGYVEGIKGYFDKIEAVDPKLKSN